MSEFEMGMMAGWAAGVATAGAVAGVLDWWRDRNRVVTIHTGYQPCAPVEQDDDFGVSEADETDRRWDPVCPRCNGRGIVRNHDSWHCPGTPVPKIRCVGCNGAGVIKPPPKKP